MVLTLNKDGTSLEGAGDDTWVSVLREKPELLQSLTTALIEAADLRYFEDALVPAVFPKKLPRLFAVPGSKQWKGIKVRSQLSTYLGFFGYGHNMAKRYWEGDPPHGWPVQVVWSTFKGPSKSCTLTLCTEIICQLLEAQEIIPANMVQWMKRKRISWKMLEMRGSEIDMMKTLIQRLMSKATRVRKFMKRVEMF